MTADESLLLALQALQQQFQNPDLKLFADKVTLYKRAFDAEHDKSRSILNGRCTVSMLTCYPMLNTVVLLLQVLGIMAAS